MKAEPARHLQRVPPHDHATEAALLGAALLDSQAASIVATHGPELFYSGTTHPLVAQAICELVKEEAPTDVGTVVAKLRLLGQLDTAGGPQAVAELQFACSAITSAPKWAEMLLDYARRRRVLTLASQVVDCTYKNVSTAGLIAEMGAASDALAMASTSSWEPHNMASVLAGEGAEAKPTIGARSDGALLLYPGKVHVFQGEPEAAKSFLAQHIAVERLAVGEHVLYVDFEAGPADVAERLVAMGASPEAICEQFHYVRPSEPLDAGARLKVAAMCAAWPITYAVVDGVAEALALNAWSENDASEVTRFYLYLPRAIARTGAAVALIDHLVKDKEAQGRYARGSGAKLAAIDGAAFKLEVIKTLSRGAIGRIRVSVVKDRHGWVRSASSGGRWAEFLVASEPDGGNIRAGLIAPAGGDDGFRPTHLMESVSRVLELAEEPMSQRGVLEATRGNRDARICAIKILVEEGYVECKPAKTGNAYTSLMPYREPVADDETGADEHESF